MSGAAARAQQQESTGKVESRVRAPASQPATAGPHGDILELQRSAGNRAVDALSQGQIPHAVQSVVNSGGQPLEPDIRTQMGSRFGHDFREVRIHTDARAADSAKLLNAKAYTVGRDVVFSEGRYSPDAIEGKRLLAHELAHVIQQSRGGSTPKGDIAEGSLEHSAEHAATQVALASGSVAVQGASGIGVARSPEDDKKKNSDSEVDAAFATWVQLDQEQGGPPSPSSIQKPPRPPLEPKPVKLVTKLGTQSEKLRERRKKQLDEATEKQSPGGANAPTTDLPAKKLPGGYRKKVQAQKRTEATANAEKHEALVQGQDRMSHEDMYNKVIAQRGFDNSVGVFEYDKTRDAYLKAKLAADTHPANADLEKLQAEKDTLDQKVRSLQGKQTRKTISTEEQKQIRGLKKQLENLRETVDKHPATKAHRKANALQSKLAISGLANPNDLAAKGVGAQAGRGDNTYVTIQVIGTDGKIIAAAQGRNTPKLHAEDVAINEILNKIGDPSKLRDAHLEVVGDQVVCSERCKPMLKRFARDYRLDSVEGTTFVGVTPEGKEHTAKITAQTATTAKAGLQQRGDEKVQGLTPEARTKSIFRRGGTRNPNRPDSSGPQPKSGDVASAPPSPKPATAKDPKSNTSGTSSPLNKPTLPTKGSAQGPSEAGGDVAVATKPETTISKKPSATKGTDTKKTTGTSTPEHGLTSRKSDQEEQRRFKAQERLPAIKQERPVIDKPPYVSEPKHPLSTPKPTFPPVKASPPPASSLTPPAKASAPRAAGAASSKLPLVVQSISPTAAQPPSPKPATAAAAVPTFSPLQHQGESTTVTPAPLSPRPAAAPNPPSAPAKATPPRGGASAQAAAKPPGAGATKALGAANTALGAVQDYQQRKARGDSTDKAVLGAAVTTTANLRGGTLAAVVNFSNNLEANLAAGQGKGEATASALGGVAGSAIANRVAPSGPVGMAVNVVNTGLQVAGAPKPVTDVTQTAADVVPANFIATIGTQGARSWQNILTGDTKAIDRQAKEMIEGKAGMPLEGYARSVDIAADLAYSTFSGDKNAKDAEQIFLRQKFSGSEKNLWYVVGGDRVLQKVKFVENLTKGKNVKEAYDDANQQFHDSLQDDVEKWAAKEATQFVKKDLPEAAEFLKKDLRRAKSGASQALSGVKAAASQGVQDAQQRASQAVSEVKQSASDAYQRAKRRVSDTVTQTRQSANNFVKDAKEAAAHAVDQTKEVLEKRVGEARNLAAEKLTELRSAADQKVANLKDAAKKRFSSLFD